MKRTNMLVQPKDDNYLIRVKNLKEARDAYYGSGK